MNRMIFALAALLLSSPGARSAEVPSGLAKLQWLVGEWAGTGEGEPGTSAAERRVEAYLDGQFLRVTGRSVYPKQERNPKGEIHEEMDVWSYDRSRDVLVLRQFDNLGFVTTYILDKAASSNERLVLIAEHLENVPRGWRARYTYVLNQPDEYQETLELDPDGKGFKAYTANRFLRLQRSAGK